MTPRYPRRYRSAYSPRRYQRQSAFYAIVAFIVVCLVIGGCAACYHLEYQKSTQTATLCSKERVATKNGGEYRVYGPDGTFVVKDSHNPFIGGEWRTNSADVYGRLSVPGRYKLELAGWRSGLFSNFKNILKAEPVYSAQVTKECSGYTK